VMKITQEGRELTLVLFDEYAKENGKIY
jgi:hypothetical protein